ncbi:MAG: N-acyl amino acid synthase FeeM domain-containing protein [Casimicrobiaceae bacterium]
MKASIRKIVKQLRTGKGTVSPVPRKKIPRRAKTKAAASPPKADVTGQTVFDDRPLRFRSLTLTEADLPALETASAIEGAFKIRVARRTGARRDAWSLVERRYTGRGYTIPGNKPRTHVFTFIAYDEGQIVGTVGLGVDTGKGLSADELYRGEIDELRARGWRICEFTRLAVDRTAASKPVLAGLFQTAYLYAAVIRGHTHAVIEVNPRHVAFYGSALKFEPVGAERMNDRVHAPAVLLCASFAAIARGLAQFAGKSPAPGTRRTLFHYGFPPDEERGVLERLRQLVANR